MFFQKIADTFIIFSPCIYPQPSMCKNQCVGKTIQRIMTPNFDRVSVVLSQKLYDLSLLLFINSKQRAGKCSIFKREKSRKYLLNSNFFFTMWYNSDFPFNYVIRGI